MGSEETPRGPWREPYEESTDLYPGLVVHDGRATGSITTGESRLPVWAFIWTAVTEGWDSVEDGWEPGQYGWTAQTTGEFLYYLMEQRGDFGRLILALANAERAENERLNQASDDHWREHHKPGDDLCECGYEDPPCWWDDPELSAPVADLLRRCLDALEVSRGVA